MTFDLNALTAALEQHHEVVRIVIVGTKGSAPRHGGTSMLVWRVGQSGTIGGGALEYEAIKQAHKMQQSGANSQSQIQPLGPALGQCCGGSVSLVFERFTSERLTMLTNGIIAAGIFERPVNKDAAAKLPPDLARQIEAAKGRDMPIDPVLTNGWLAESLWENSCPVWIFGAGHVGRALAAMLAPLPEFDITLIDTNAARMPTDLPAGVTPLIAATMADLVKHAPIDAHHFIMTMSHNIDLEICHALLGHPFAYAGLIGSKTKWVRFHSRLEKLGHKTDEINRITCPIGEPILGNEPQAIAVGVARGLLLQQGGAN